MAQIYSGRDVGRYVEPLLRGAQRFLLVASPWISGSYARLLVGKARSGAVVYVVTSDARGNEAALRVFSTACRAGGDLGLGEVSWPRFLVLLLLLGFGFPLLSVYLAAEHDWPWLMVAWGLAALYAAYRLVVSGWGILLIPVGAAPWYLFFYAAYRLGLSDEPPRLEGGYLVTLVLLGAYTAGVALLAWGLSEKSTETSHEHGSWDGRGGIHVLVVPSRLMSHAKILVTEHGAVVGSANLTQNGLWRNMETVTLYTPDEAEPIYNQFWAIWEDARRNARGYTGCGHTLDNVTWEEPDYKGV